MLLLRRCVRCLLLVRCRPWTERVLLLLARLVLPGRWHGSQERTQRQCAGLRHLQHRGKVAVGLSGKQDCAPQAMQKAGG